MQSRRNKRGQLMIWVIVAITIVVIIALFFVIRKVPTLISPQSFNPKPYIDKCVRDSVTEAIGIMLPQGGFIAPDNYKVYNDKNISYLCENIGNYHPCISQHPLLLNEMKQEILNYTRPRMEQCFQSMKAEVEKRQETIAMGDMNMDVALAPGRVYLNIKRDITIQRGSETTQLNEFNTIVSTPLYDLGNVAMNIAANEAKYCYFEYVGYMVLYPRWNIEKFAMSDATKIYTINDKYSGKEMNIAIRSCTIPPGI